MIVCNLQVYYIYEAIILFLNPPSVEFIGIEFKVKENE